MTERDIATRGRVDADIAHRINGLAVLGLPAHDQIETAVAFKHLGHCLSADCRLHDGGDVAGIETVARRRRPIGLDDNVGLAERAEHKHVGDAAHLLERLGNSVSDRFVSIKIITEDLDRIRSRLNA